MVSARAKVSLSSVIHYCHLVIEVRQANLPSRNNCCYLVIEGRWKYKPLCSVIHCCHLVIEGRWVYQPLSSVICCCHLRMCQSSTINIRQHKILNLIASSIFILLNFIYLQFFKTLYHWLIWILLYWWFCISIIAQEHNQVKVHLYFSANSSCN